MAVAVRRDSGRVGGCPSGRFLDTDAPPLNLYRLRPEHTRIRAETHSPSATVGDGVRRARSARVTGPGPQRAAAIARRDNSRYRIQLRSPGRLGLDCIQRPNRGYK
ncbi:MAG: hypothetical protein AMXMBFR47_13610 [Planctomycetota bacterium]